MTGRIFIALGSNVGDRDRALRDAVAALDAHPQIQVIQVAEAIETAAVDSPPGAGDFLNSAAELRTPLGPEDLLAAMLDVERVLGRQRSVPNAPRTIDLDLLLYGNAAVATPALTLPHPRLHQRRFVLAPLASIAADVVHPTLGRSIGELLQSLDDTERSSR